MSEFKGKKENKNCDNLVELIDEIKEDKKDKDKDRNIQLLTGASVPRKDTIERINNAMIAASQNARYSFVPEKDLFNYIEKIDGASVTKNYIVDTTLDSRFSSHQLSQFGYFDFRGKRGDKEYKYTGPIPFTTEDAIKIGYLINNLKQARKLKVAKILLQKQIDESSQELEVQEEPVMIENFSHIELPIENNEKVDLDAFNESYRNKSTQLLEYSDKLNDTVSELTEIIKLLINKLDRLEK